MIRTGVLILIYATILTLIFNLSEYLYADIYHDLDLYQNLYLDLDLYLKIFLNNHREIYQAHYPELYPDLNLYRNFHQYMDADFYPLDLPELAERFDRKLLEGIRLVKRMEQAKVFRGVNLQHIVREFKAQRKFIKASIEGKSIRPPEISIREAWFLCFGYY